MSDRANATRAKLLAAARQLFVERGYEATSTAEILTRTGVSRGALYHHFAGKQELFAAVFEEVEREVAERISPDPSAFASDPLGALRAACSDWLAITQEPVVRQISLIDAPAVLGWHRWRAIDEQYGFGAMKLALQAAVEAGQLEPQPVDVLAHILIAALGEAAMLIARAEDADAARSQAELLFNRVLDGFATEGEQRPR